jgi:hypothetical protein
MQFLPSSFHFAALGLCNLKISATGKVGDISEKIEDH